jgi:hypothetical protein
MSRALKITLIILLVAVVAGAIYLRGLHRRILQLGRPEQAEVQARREIVQPPIATPTDVRVKAKLFWASLSASGSVEAVEVELRLSAEPVQRAKQLINALILNAPKPEQRTLPAELTLLELYILPDGTAIADFSQALATATPSGIVSEQLAVDSIARTLEANVPGLRRLKIVVNGQETETLAGHVDLTDFFELHAAAEAEAGARAATGAGGAGLTPPPPPGKLND